ncbi:MAG: YgjV family protein [Firmicutes bacterium]|nr:YgjV family protein [Bacillota bacterium]
MFNFDVPLWQWIVSQILASIALISIIYAFQSKTKARTMFFVAVFNFLMTFSVMLLSNWVLVGIYSVAVFRDLVFLWREKKYPKNTALSYVTLVVFLGASSIIGFFTWDWWFDTFIIVLGLFVIFGSWAKGVHLIRISRFVFCIITIINHIIFLNIIGVGIEVFVIVSITVFYIRFIKKKAKNNLNDELQHSNQDEQQSTNETYVES